MRSQQFDAITIGSGLAGLAFALSFAEHGSVCILTKAQARDSNTSLAQGGIAAAVGEADSWKLHEQDTLVAGAGLCNPEAVRFLVQNAPAAIEWLQSLGATFTVARSGEFELGLEGGHSRHRIVHFEDRTGWEVERAMIAAVRKHPRITVLEHAFVTSLAVENGRCVGAAAEIEGFDPTFFSARAIMLATGGCGQLYLHTTNPRVATGDGIALASEAGAEITGMEFMQFHPTTLYHQQLRNYLITEATRGAGATIRNHRGRRFMYDYDERLELAPRDVVARSIVLEMMRLDTWCVYLDLAHLPREEVRAEFPTICEKLATVGIEMDKDWIPIVPAQHYSCGGVSTDLNGRTTIRGLYAAGEVASTGVHGANRLASNSLLEALVFARSAASTAVDEPAASTNRRTLPTPTMPAEIEAINLRKSLQSTMHDHVGIIRTNAGLRAAADRLASLTAEFDAAPKVGFAPYSAETRNLLVAAGHVVRGALARKQNVGLHYNLDLVDVDDSSPKTQDGQGASEG